MTTQTLPGLAVLLVSGFLTFGDTQEDRYVGEWRGAYRGKVFVVLKLENKKGLRGSLGSGQIHVGEDGLIDEVGEEAGEPRPLIDVKLVGEKLSFRCKDSDGEIDHYEMKLTGESSAELRLLLVGLPEAVKPFTLKRSK